LRFVARAKRQEGDFGPYDNHQFVVAAGLVRVCPTAKAQVGRHPQGAEASRLKFVVDGQVI
jgi:hypothetical protein